jgi:isoquinoline 1-oxidoreductase subunit beta
VPPNDGERAIVKLRRSLFIRIGVAAGGGLLIGLSLPGCTSSQTSVFSPNAWIRIGADDTVTVLVDKAEMGQGVYTALPAFVAEELEVDPARIVVEAAPARPEYLNQLLGPQITGTSSSVRASWIPMSQAGAVARSMLVAAAAGVWRVPERECIARDGAVLHVGTGRRLTYGALADRASRMRWPGNVALKAPAEYRVIGKSLVRKDTPAKVDGSATFGLDVALPGLLIAVVARPPSFGSSALSFDATRARAVRGVRDVVQISSGVAVVADAFWPAKLGRDALSVSWTSGPNAHLSSAAIAAEYARLENAPGVTARREGDPGAMLARATRRFDAAYDVPFAAHATMEPMNATADVRPDSCDVWAPTQNQTGAALTAAQILKRAPSSINVHTTFLGGGFGRRADVDYVEDAVETSAAVSAPVKVIFTREDDFTHDFYRGAYRHRLAGAIDDVGDVVAWTHRVIGPSVNRRAYPIVTMMGLDSTSVEGADSIAYSIPNVLVDCVTYESGVPVGFWRSVGHSHTVFAVECFLDELAHAAGRDPLDFRRALLRNAPRHRAVLETAAANAGWGSVLPTGRARGLAVCEAFGSFVAQVAEVSVDSRGAVTVHRVVCAIDCGRVVNPNIVEAQMEGGIVFGLTAALKDAVTIKDGAAEQRNFGDYRMVRMREMPSVETHIVRSDADPGGVGETAVPPIAPAVANAIFALTGKRLRALPLRMP